MRHILHKTSIKYAQQKYEIMSQLTYQLITYLLQSRLIQLQIIKRMKIVPVLFIINLITTSTSTRLFLQSWPEPAENGQIVTEIPQLYNHEFSCELVFFNVHKDKFIAEIKQIPKNVSLASISIYTYEDENKQIKYENTTLVINCSAIFPVDLVKMHERDNFEVIMWFNITYIGTKQSELRKAYMLFSQKSNQQQYLVKLPNKTIIITQICGLALMLILPWNVQYRKFLPFTFNLITCLLYILILMVALYLQILFGSNNIIYQFQRFFVGIFELFCLVMYSQDLAMLITERKRISYLFGLIFGIIIMICDYFVPILTDAWFLNDIIAIMIAGAFIKFVIIRKMKSSVWAIGMLWIFCILREFAKYMRIQKFDQGLGIRVVPLFLQLPAEYLDNSTTITCSAFGSSKIIAFGIILNYCKRIDLSQSTHFYRVLVSVLAIICVGIELLINLTLLNQLPTVQVGSVILFYPLAILLMVFFANKRGEWTEMWNGSFYDMAVNRASIPRSVSFQGLQSDFGRDLMINSAISSERDRKNNFHQKQIKFSI